MTDSQKDLNQRIAELLGWTVVLNKGGFSLRHPAGEAGVSVYMGESGAWSQVTDYEHSLDAVFAALPKDVSLTICDYGKDTKFAAIDRSVQVEDPMAVSRFTDYGETCQQAAAKALLSYLQTVNAEAVKAARKKSKKKATQS